MQHDMGLMGGLFYGIYSNFTQVLLSPALFLANPYLWLKTISDYKASAAASPSFGYQLCIDKISQEQLETLDLSSWNVAFNGSEPIWAKTMEDFIKKFSICGFKKETFLPCYGLAEATLFVSGKPYGTEYVQEQCDKTTLVSSGSIYHDFVVKIINPETCAECSEHEEGEIWVRGPSIAQGYWKDDQHTQETFKAKLPHDDHEYLRTGDLGFLKNNELFVTARLKDLIILQGRNVYPQDVEKAVEQAHPAIRQSCVAAFTIASEKQEQLVLVVEIDRKYCKIDFEPVFQAIRKAVVNAAEAIPYSIQLLSPGQTLKTTSGKIQRKATKDAYLENRLITFAKEDLYATPITQTPSKDELEKQLSLIVKKVLALDSLELTSRFTELGGTSLHAVVIQQQIQTYLNNKITLSATLVFDYPTVAQLSEYLYGCLTGNEHELAMHAQNNSFIEEPIAIIGMSCRFPGKANTPDDFWKLLHEERDGIQEIPSQRWHWQDYEAELLNHQGGFIDNIEYFDADFFNISPREANTLDPQQRLVLETTWETLERAGILPNTLTGTDTSVFVGAATHEYGDLLVKNGQDESYIATGNSNSAIAGRVSYVLGLQGPSLSIDTACSSSLVAIHEACNSLHLGETSLAVVAGVNAIISPDGFIQLSKANMLSRRGYCQVFSEKADGYVRGEGCGVVLLKRLADAQRDKDAVLAVIKSSVVNQDGASSGLTVPNGVAQEKLLHQALADANLSAQDIDCIEAHGTGTVLGDPMELNALAHVFSGSHQPEKPLIISSVKANIGHLEAAAGLASLIKMILCLQKEQIPTQIHVGIINDKIKLDTIPGCIPPTLLSWDKKANHKRRAGISSFGFTGTNAHLILEEAPEQERTAIPKTIKNQLEKQEHVLVISGKSTAALQAQIERYKFFLQHTNEAIYDICYSSQIARTRFEHLVTLSGKTIEELLHHLEHPTESATLRLNTSYADKYHLYLKKVNLPTYAFQNHYYWALTPEHKLKSATKEKAVHPLLGAPMAPLADHQETAFEQIITTHNAAHSFLEDHRVHGLNLFPGTGFVELILAGLAYVRREHPVQIVQINSITIERPLIVSTEHGLQLQTIITPTKDDQLLVRVFAKELNEAHGETNWQLHAQGLSKVVESNVQETVSLGELELRYPHTLERHQFYSMLDENGLHYGLLFQTVKTLHYAPNELFARLECNLPTNNQYHMFPSLFDGALQSLACLVQSHEQQESVVYLPTGFEHLTLYQSLPSSCYVQAQLDHSQLQLTGILKANLNFLDDKGLILAKIIGFTAKRTSRSLVLHATGERKKIERWCYEAIWEPFKLDTLLESENELQDLEPMVYDARGKDSAIKLQNPLQLLSFLQRRIQVNTNKKAQKIIIVTQQAFSLASETININQATLNGLIKTAILEHPELAICQLDVMADENIKPLLAQLAKADPVEQLFAHRLGQWYLCRVQHETQAAQIQHRLLIPDYEYHLTKSKSGVLEAINLKERDPLTVGENEILVGPKAVGLNFRDVLNAMNIYPGDPGPLGGDFSGIVKKIGKKISTFNVGDEVLGITTSGSLANEAITTADLLVKKPDSISFAQAASIPTVFCTAYYSLIALAKLQAKETVLIHAGTGGVGLAAIQIARYCGAKIIATAGSPEKSAYLKNIGIEHVFDSRSTSYRQAITEVTEGRGVDVVLNSLSGEGFIEATLECTAPNARFIEIGKRAIWSPEQIAAKCRDIVYHIVALDVMMAESPTEFQSLLHEVMQLIALGKLMPIQLKTIPLTHVIDAFMLLQKAKHMGKIVIEIPHPQVQFDPNASYLITGGMGGVGLAVANFLAEHNAGRIILASRSTPNEHTRARINDLQNKGILVQVHQCDVSKKEEVVALIKISHTSEHPLKGIFHTAGIIQDALLGKQTAENIKSVFAAKAMGAWYLSTLTQKSDIALDYFVLFSSIASLIGSPGQGNYALANSFLDALAVQRQQNHLPALSINWGPWRETGMAKELVFLHRSRGLLPFKTKDALEVLDYALRQGTANIGIMPIHQKRFTAQLIYIPSWLKDIAERKQKISLMKQLQASTPEQREKILKDTLVSELRHVLSLSSSQQLDENKDFFSLGMDSLIAMEFVNRVGSQMGVHATLSPALAFEHNTIQKLTTKLMELLGSAPNETNVKEISQENVLDNLLSTNQMRLWFIHQLLPESRAYSIYLRVRARGEIHIPYLQQAIDAVVKRHDVLRCRIKTEQGKPYVEYLAANQEFLHLKEFDLMNQNKSEQDIDDLFTAELNTPFALDSEPLTRFYVMLLDNMHFEIGFIQHHIISDFVSIRNLWEEIALFYNALSANAKPNVQNLPAVYADYVKDNQNYLRSAQYAVDMAYWQETLAHTEHTRFPYDFPPQLPEGYEAAYQTIEISNEMSKKLLSTSRTLNSTLYSLLLSCCYMVLTRYSGQSDLIIGATTFGRNRLEYESLLGFFVNTIALRLKNTAEKTVAHFVQQVGETVADGMKHEQAPFHEVIQSLNLERDLYHNPLFDISFILYSVNKNPLFLTNTQLESLRAERGANFPIAFEMTHDGDGVSGTIKYDKRLFKAETIARITESYQLILEQITNEACYQTVLHELNILPEQEQEKILKEFNNTAQEFPEEKTIHQLFEEQVEKAPDQIAVLFEGQQLTYRELNNKANQLAHHLCEQGISSESMIGVSLPRSLESVVALYGIIKAGGAYVPIDPCLPQKRKDFLLADVNAPLCITMEYIQDFFNTKAANYTSDNLPFTADPNNAIYVIYTSGSTGKPKGVINIHRALCNRLWWMQRQFKLNAEDVVLQKTPFNFDVSVWEFFWPLLFGARLVVAKPDGHKDPRYLSQIISKYKVTTLHFVPSMLSAFMIDKNKEAFASVRQVFVSGEALPAKVLTEFHQFYDAKLINLYGPTEAAIDVSWWDTDDYRSDQIVPIGKPIDNISLYILDKNRKIVPLGVTGDLYIGGIGLARGYLNRADLNTEKFIPNPYDSKGRVYATGDLARYLPDGNIEYLGRNDNQIKLRGFRIELGEIEQAIMAFPAVKQAVVLVKGTNQLDKFLIAYLVLDAKNTQLQQQELIDFLKTSLPEYMIPSCVEILAELPLNSNGKIDRIALSQLEQDKTEIINQTDKKDVLQSKLEAIWHTVLPGKTIKREASFFELGGTSLTLIQLQHEIRTQIGFEIELVDLFRYPKFNLLLEFLSQKVPHISETITTRDDTTERGSKEDSQEINLNDIAIIGMSGRFPESPDIESFWENLIQGKELISFFSEQELLENGIPETVINDPSYVKAKGILSNIDQFDADFFNLSSHDALLSDPQLRIFYEVAWHALEDAGYASSKVLEKTGIFAGMGHSGYAANQVKEIAANPQEQFNNYLLLINNEKDFLANHTAYLLNLRGPAVTVQTACSTSLVSVCLAAEAISRGDCSMALAGGVSIMLPQKQGYFYIPDMIFSPDGHCKAFDADAQGTVLGEGVGIVVLKRLQDAINDKDTIHAVIKGKSINNDGAVKMNYTAPGIEGQIAVINEAIKNANINPESISYVEAHGTGTILGDPLEFTALNEVFSSYTQNKQFCALGSVKSNIGHLDAASGIAGLIKAIQIVRHKMIPPSAYFKEPNPKIDLKNSPFYVNNELIELKHDNQPIRIGVSSFGIGGTNAHVILESPPIMKGPDVKTDQKPVLLTLSARNKESLNALINSYTKLLKEKSLSIADIAYSSHISRKHFEYRIGVIGSSCAEMRQKLISSDFHTNCYDLNASLQEHFPKDLTQLAQAYVAGEDINWSQLHATEELEKIKLPLYPFNRKHYWAYESQTPFTKTQADWFYTSKWLELDVQQLSPSQQESVQWILLSEQPTDFATELYEQMEVLPLNILQSTFAHLENQIKKESIDLKIIDLSSAYLLRSAALKSLEDALAVMENVFTQYKSLLQQSNLKHIAFIDFDLNSNELPNAMQGTLSGLAKAISWEYPEINCQMIHFNSEDKNQVPLLLGELNSSTAEEHIVFKNNHRFVWRFAPALFDSQPKMHWDTHGSYLITGGLGGLGFALCKWLAKKNVEQIVLVSRNEPSTDALLKINAIQNEFDCRILCKKADISDKKSLESIISSLTDKKTDYPLLGIYHLAGNDQFESLQNYSNTLLQKVYSGKVKGAWHLHELTKNYKDLQFFVLFSSLSSFLGSNQQSGYVMANSFLDSLADDRRKTGLPVTCINWGPWNEAGMSMKHLDCIPEELVENTFISLEKGMLMLDKIIQAAPSENIAIVSPDYLSFMLSLRPHLPEHLTHLIQTNNVDSATNNFYNLYQKTAAEARYKLLEDTVTESLTKVLKLPGSESINNEQGFAELGLDSLMAIGLHNELKNKLGSKIPLRPTLAFDYPNIKKLSLYIHRQLEGKGQEQLNYISHAFKSEPVAIIGMACRFPGGANSLEEYWQHLIEGKDAVSLDNQGRWDAKESPYKSGLIDNIKLFDAQFFNVTPREATDMDPQQRLLLETSWHALENAALNPDSLVGTDTGVFIGVTQSDYGMMSFDKKETDNTNYLISGNALNVTAGRLSYFYGLHGPSMAMDTACSSSLVSVHEACRSLQTGESHLAIAAGVNVLLIPEIFAILTQANMLSPDGHCKTFDESANGYVRGEGCGVLILKRLSDAQHDNDRILAIIKGSAVNQDGKSSGLTVPNGIAQEEVIKKALANAELHPEDVDHIETHGSATYLGDPIEVAALGTVYSQNRTEDTPLILTAVKTHIGHLESAAGVAGIIKTVLALQHGQIPPNLHFKNINQRINLQEIPAIIPVQAIPWPEREHAKTAAVSGFGISGTNAHVILQEYKNPMVTSDIPVQEKHLLILFAKNQTTLNKQIDLYVDYLKQSDEKIENICYTAQLGRAVFDCAVAVVGKDNLELIQQLETRNFALEEEIAAVKYPEDFTANKVSLPNYPFERKEYWHSPIQKISLRSPAQTPDENENIFLQNRLILAQEQGWIYEALIDCNTPNYIKDHLVYGKPVVAGAVYFSIILAWIYQEMPNRNLAIHNLSILRPMILIKEQGLFVQTHISSEQNGAFIFGIFSSQDKVEWNQHAEGKIATHFNKEHLDTFQVQHIEVAEKEFTYESTQHAALFKKFGIDLGAHFHWLERSATQENHSWTQVRAVNKETEYAGQILHPGLIDTLFQSTAAIVAERLATMDSPYIPYTIDEFFYDATPDSIKWIYSSLNESDDPNMAVSDMLLFDEKMQPIGYVKGLKARKATKEQLASVLEKDLLKEVDSYFYEIQWPALNTPSIIKPNHINDVYIVSDNHNEADVLTNILNGNAHAVFYSDRKEERITNTFQELQDKNSTLTDLIYFVPKTKKTTDIKPATNLLVLLQKLIASKLRPRLYIVTSGAYNFGNDEINFAHSFVNGVIKVLTIENPELYTVQIDYVDKNNDLSYLNDIAKITLNNYQEQIILSRNHEFFKQRIMRRSQKTNYETKQALFDPSAHYIITGGLGEIGFELAQWLSLRGVKYLTLASRRKIDTLTQSVIEGLEKNGVHVQVESLDLGKKESVIALIEKANSITPLKGVFHAAGILDDATISRQNTDKFKHVITAKALSAWHIHQILADKNIKLDHFILFSSAASVNGSPGQSNYAAANSFLDALAHYCRQQGLNAKSINWGPWQEIGMAKNTIGHYHKQGLRGLLTEEALLALERVLIDDLPQQMIIKSDWDLLSKQFGRVPSWFQSLISPQLSQSHLLAEISGLPVNERAEKLKEALYEEVKNTIGLSSIEALDENKGFFEMGMDSLMAMDLKNRLQTLFDRPLSSTLVFDYPTLLDLYRYFLAEINGEFTQKESPDSLMALNKTEDDEIETTNVMNEIEKLLQDFDHKE